MIVILLLLLEIGYFTAEHPRSFASAPSKRPFRGPGEYLPLPAEFGCCSLKDEFTLRDKGVPQKGRKLQNFIGFEMYGLGYC